MGNEAGFSGKTVLVTGGSRGLGAAISGGFSRAGANLVIASRDGESCRVLAERLKARDGTNALPYAIDVAHWEEAPGLVDAAVERFGGIDVLVNNAGMSPLYDSVEEVNEYLFDKVMGVNLKGPFRLAALAGSWMRDHTGGSIVNLSSMAAVRPRPHMLPYAAAKAGLNALSVGLAHTFGPAVRVNAVMAGTFLTDVARHWDPDVFAARAQTFALRRGGNPDEIVGAVLFLASEAASYVTGSVLTVDGGQP